MRKQRKCSFVAARVEYLVHTVSKKGVSTDLAKIKAIMDWPIPVDVGRLHSFLGRAGYYGILWAITAS